MDTKLCFTLCFVLYSIIMITMSQNTMESPLPQACEGHISEMNARLNTLEKLQGEILRRLDEIREKDFPSSVAELKTYMDENIYTPEINTYTVYYSLKSWSDARAYCQQQGMDLASINSMTEREYVVGKITNSCSEDGFWIAAYKSGNAWIWANDNTAVDPQLWRAGQPDGNGQYGKFWTTYNLEMDDDVGTDRLCFICESNVE